MPLSKQVQGRNFSQTVPSCSLAAELCGIVTYAQFPQQPMSSLLMWHTPPDISVQWKASGCEKKTLHCLV